MNGEFLNSQGIGIMTFDVYNAHGELLTITLCNCVYSQDVDQNLISVSKIVDPGNQFLMSRDTCLIQHQDDDVTRAERTGNAFFLQSVFSNACKVYEAKCSHAQCLFAQYQRLAH